MRFKSCYLKSLEPGLLLLQGLLLLLLVHAAEGHAGGGEGRDCAGQGGRSAGGEETEETGCRGKESGIKFYIYFESFEINCALSVGVFAKVFFFCWDVMYFKET